MPRKRSQIPSRKELLAHLPAANAVLATSKAHANFRDSHEEVGACFQSDLGHDHNRAWDRAAVSACRQDDSPWCASGTCSICDSSRGARTGAVTDAAHEKTADCVKGLETAARAYAQHSGPESSERERALFSQDLRAAAMRYARAYYAEARAYGLVRSDEVKS